MPRYMLPIYPRADEPPAGDPVRTNAFMLRGYTHFPVEYTRNEN